MHGVGARFTLEALRARRVRERPSRCPSRTSPDGAFPTVSFPNPEEPGALDLALALARRRAPTSSSRTTPTPTGSPPARATAAAGCVIFSGNELGVLLGATA